jgi:integrase
MPDGRYVLERRGETTQSLRDRWRRHALTAGGQPLELDLLRELLPPELWPVLLWLIAEGPTLAAARVEMALLIEAEEPVRRRDRRHHDDSVTSDSQLRSMGAAAKALMDTLVALKVRSARLGPSLAAWQQTPAFTVPLRDEASTDTTAPGRPEVRLLWQRTCADVARRLPAAAELGEVEAIRRLTPTQLRTGGHFSPLRTRVLLVLLAVVGSRVGAIPRLQRCDFVRDHRFPDGSRGPALALRPGKRKRLTKVHWKGLPEGAAAVIESYLAYMERFLGPFSPDDKGPLLHSTRKRDTPWSAQEMTSVVSGCNGKRPKRALLPRGSDPFHGFSPHTFRSFCARSSCARSTRTPCSCSGASTPPSTGSPRRCWTTR